MSTFQFQWLDIWVIFRSRYIFHLVHCTLITLGDDCFKPFTWLEIDFIASVIFKVPSLLTFLWFLSEGKLVFCTNRHNAIKLVSRFKILRVFCWGRWKTDSSTRRRHSLFVKHVSQGDGSSSWRGKRTITLHFNRIKTFQRKYFVFQLTKCLYFL